MCEVTGVVVEMNVTIRPPDGKPPRNVSFEGHNLKKKKKRCHNAFSDASRHRVPQLRAAARLRQRRSVAKRHRVSNATTSSQKSDDVNPNAPFLQNTSSRDRHSK